VNQDTVVILLLAAISISLLILERRANARLRQQLHTKNFNERKSVTPENQKTIAEAAHQLRTPLSIARGFLSGLETEVYGAVAPRQRQPIAQAHRSIVQLAQLLDSYLYEDATQYQAVRLMAVDLVSFVESILVDFQELAAHKNLTLSFTHDTEEMWRVQTDPLKLTEIFHVLLENALAYTQQGSITVKLSRHTTDSIKVNIVDTGIGIDQRFIAQVFADHYRSPSAIFLHRYGRGVGLTLAQRAAKLIGAEISIDSPGSQKGTTATVTLPLWAGR
jgi:signal transduction histidine kinase